MSKPLLSEKAPPAPVSNAPGPPVAASPGAVPHIHRMRIALNVGFQLLLGLVLYGLVNYLGARHFKQWDYTYDRKFTLAPNTVDFLKKVTVPIRITALTVRGTEPEKDLSALLQQYQEAMKGKVEIKVIDTRRDTAAWESFKAQIFKSKTPTIESNGILVQADAPSSSPGAVAPQKWISEEALYDIDPIKKTASAFKGESLLNSAIRGVTTIKRPRIGIVSGRGKLRILPDGSSAFNILARVASLQNIDLEPYPIMEREGPEGLDSLIWIAPGDIGEREVEILTRFLETPGHSMLVMLNPEIPTPNLDKFLGTYGIVPQEDRVLSAVMKPTGPVKRFDVENARFLDGTVLTQGIVSQSINLLGQTRSLKVVTGSEKQRAENIDVKPLLSPPADVYWGDKNFEEVYPRPTKGVDNEPPIYVMAAAERGAAKDPRVQMKSSRLIVFGNSLFADPDSTDPNNYDFLIRSVNWMLHRDVVAPNDSATDKMKHRFRIQIKPQQWQRIFWTTTIILPLVALMTGLMVWSARRN